MPKVSCFEEITGGFVEEIGRPLEPWLR